jgi:hypothetical protein
VLTWIADHWSEITTVAAALVAILKWIGQARYATILEGIVKAVEEHDSSILKRRISVETKKTGTAAILDKIVQKVTEGGAA